MLINLLGLKGIKHQYKISCFVMRTMWLCSPNFEAHTRLQIIGYVEPPVVIGAFNRTLPNCL